MEVFFRRGKHKHFFVDFGHTKEDAKGRNVFARLLCENMPRNSFKHWPNSSPYRLVPEHGIQDRWLAREITNFEYLMALNTISGRSFNDLCQYPVFPWIIAQYTDAVLDLSAPETYRDLSKPVGALNPNRLQEFMDRYESFQECLSHKDIPPFM
jgi:hypothetical protein